jgi:hypothetical protein
MKGQEAFHPIPERDRARRPWRAALLPRLGPDLVQRLPEPQTTVAGGELGVHLQAVLVAQPEEQLAPTLGALAKAVLDRQQLLVAIGIGADDDQQALAVVVEPRREIDAVGPNVDEAPPREIATLPALVLLLPSRHQPAHRRGRETGRVGAQERRQGLLELAGRDALQIEPGQQLLDVPGPPQERRQDLRGEADALAARPSPRSRSFGRRTEIGPIPVWISRSGACPLRTTRRRPCASSSSACAPRNASISASITCCSIRRAPSRSTSSSGSSATLAPGRAKRTTVSLSMAYPFGDFEHHRGYAASTLIHQIRA